MSPYQRLQTIEIWDHWTLPELAADWTDYLRRLTGIPVTLTLHVVTDTDEDEPYHTVRIQNVTIPREWDDRLGPWKSLLTSDPDDCDSPIFLACWEDYLQGAPIRVLPHPDHSPAWCIKILHHRVVQALVIDSPNPPLKPTQ